MRQSIIISIPEKTDSAWERMISGESKYEAKQDEIFDKISEVSCEIIDLRSERGSNERNDCLLTQVIGMKCILSVVSDSRGGSFVTNLVNQEDFFWWYGYRNTDLFGNINEHNELRVTVKSRYSYCDLVVMSTVAVCDISDLRMMKSVLEKKQERIKDSEVDTFKLETEA